MFEDSMLESRGTIKTRKGSTVVVSVAVHMILVTALILLPLAYTEQIQGATLTSFLVAPPPPPPGPPPGPAAVAPKPAAERSVAVDPTALIEPKDVPVSIAVIVDVPSDLSAFGGVGVPGGRSGNGVENRNVLIIAPPTLREATPPPPPPPPPPPIPVTRHQEPIRVGGSVQAGNLLAHRNPDYPPLARAARVEGTVILSATIGDDGSIKELRVVSATNPLLLPGVIDTLKTWKYKPTLLNSEPVEVLTTITVNFSLGGR